MKVVLMQDVPKLGGKFQVLDVSDGYARNFLIPRRLAVPATPTLLREVEKRKQQERPKEQRDLKQAQALAQRLADLVVEVAVPAGESGRLYHAVSAREIAVLLEEQYGIKLDRNQIGLDEPLRSLGVHSVPVRLHRQVKTTLKVHIIAAPA